jgi:hypothetical protein
LPLPKKKLVKTGPGPRQKKIDRDVGRF